MRRKMTLPSNTDLTMHFKPALGSVSGGLNGHNELSGETRKSGAEAAKAPGHRPFHAVRRHRKGEPQTIGFVVNPTKVGDRHAAAFYYDIIRSIQRQLSEYKLDLTVLTASSDEEISEYVRRIATRRIVDGFILAETRPSDDRIAFLEKAGVPFVAFGRSETPGNYRWLDIDFPGMAASCVDRFHALGHREIAIALGSTELYYITKFLEFFRKRLDELGLPFREDCVFRTGGDVREGEDIARRIASMSNRPTAIISLYGSPVPGLYRGLHEFGLVPGRDLAILAHVNEDVVGPLSPTLSGYTFNVEDVGQNLARLLVASIPEYSNTVSQDAPNILLPMTYVAGATDIRPAMANN
jgi:DNA-binding LacI/PurR family transcriptional regulator